MSIMGAQWIHFFLFGILFWTAAAIDKEDIGNANDYVDIVLENLRKEPEVVKHLDPLNVPGVSDKKYKLRNVIVKGLSNLFRNGDCSLSVDGDNVNVVAEIAVRGVKVTMDYSAKALFFWIHGDAVVGVDHLAVRLDLSSTDGNARLNSFKVVNLGNYYVKSIRGASVLLNWLLKIIANKIVHNAKGSIITALETGAKDALDKVLRKYKLPVY